MLAPLPGTSSDKKRKRIQPIVIGALGSIVLANNDIKANENKHSNNENYTKSDNINNEDIIITNAREIDDSPNVLQSPASEVNNNDNNSSSEIKQKKRITPILVSTK